MTISKTDLDKWIERESDKLYDGASASNRICRQGAQLLAPLLLQVFDALRDAEKCLNWITSVQTVNKNSGNFSDCLETVEKSAKALTQTQSALAPKGGEGG